MKELEKLTRIFWVSIKGKVFLTDNIWFPTPLDEIKKVGEGLIQYKKDPKNWVYGIDLDVGTVIVPKMISNSLVGKIPESARYYFVDECKSVSETKSQSRITYYNV
ncbi:hypothetical protein GW932_01915 [archaeon]|nr:hypothetical protein [archaeon]